MNTDADTTAGAGISPLPWKARSINRENIEIVSGRYPVAHIHFDPLDAAEMEANAAYIIMACNCHSALMDALMSVMKEIGSSSTATDAISDKTFDKVTAALLSTLPSSVSTPA